MFRFVVVVFACLALCHCHAVLPLPLVSPAVHPGPLVVPYPLYHGYAGHGYLGHGLLAKPLVHHLLKRSPHYVAPLTHIAPVAVSHQSRVDVHSSPAVVAAPILPVIKPVVAPLLPYAPLLHKPLIATPLHYGVGHYGSLYPHYGHY